jgi:hypothetical protein
VISKSMTLSDFAFVVYQSLKSRKIEAVLSGGAVVSVYTSNEYESRDLDFISPNLAKDINRAMVSMGFSKSGQNYRHPNTEFTVEFPPGPLAVGDELLNDVKETTIGGRKIKILSPTDAIKDRLAGWFHFHDPQNLEQARMLYHAVGGDLKKIKKWAAGEGALEQFKVFVESLKSRR